MSKVDELREETTEYWADWLLDAVAGATQDRRFLRGDDAYDSLLGEAILLNGHKAIRNAVNKLVEAARQEGREEERARAEDLRSKALVERWDGALRKLADVAPPPSDPATVWHFRSVSEPAKRVATAFACPSCQSLNVAVDEDCLCLACGGAATPIDNDGRVVFEEPGR